MNKILVTGGAGFIGSNFINYWIKNHSEDKIVNLDILTYAGNLDNLKEVSQNPNYTFIKGDITNVDDVENAMDGCDTVVHFAAESHNDRAIIDPQIFVTTNVIGTSVLLNQAKKNNIKRFHHISTDEVFGSLELNDGKKFDENTNYNPRSPYSASKAGSDHLVRAYFETFDLPVTITNCGNNFGPYQHPEKFLPRMITNLLSGENIKVYGDGLNVRDWVDVEDHCRAIDLILQNGKKGETYCIGGTTEDVNNLDLSKKVLKVLGLGEEKIEFVQDRPGHDRRYALDWTKIKSELGWEPVKSFDQRLEETVNWYKDNEWWWKPLKEKAESIYKK